MIERERTFQNADGITISYREWLPDHGPILALVFILHGLGEHSGRYRHVAEPLTDVGFACYGIDHLGHGNSGGTRAYIPDAQLAIDDLDQLCGIVSAEHPELPALLFGHSMGSLIGLGFALRYPNRLQGVATTGTPLHGERRRPAWLVSLCLKAANYIPKIRLSPPGGPSILTADKDMLQEWWDDPLVDKGMWRVGTSAALIRLARDICANAHKLTPPLLIMHGEGDHLVPASGSAFLAETAGSTDVTLKLYPDLRHELVNEINRDEIINTLRNWLLDHV